MSKKLNKMLDRWGELKLSELENGTWEQQVSLTYRIWKYGTSASSGLFEHKILCADWPADMRELDIAIRKLPRNEMRCLAAKYLFIRDSEGREITDAYRAGRFSMTKYAYKSMVKRAKNRIGNKINV